MVKTIWVSVKSENGSIVGAEAHKSLHGSILGILSDIESRSIIDDDEGKCIANALEKYHSGVWDDGTEYKIMEVCLRK